MNIIFLLLTVSVLSWASSPFGGPDSQKDLRISFAIRLLEFIEPIKDDGQPTLSFFLQNDASFYTKYWPILNTQIPILPSKVNNQKFNGPFAMKPKITLREALVYFGIPGIFNVFTKEPIVQETLFLMKRECQTDMNIFKNKLASLEQADAPLKGKL